MDPAIIMTNTPEEALTSNGRTATVEPQRPQFTQASEEKAFNEILELVEKDRPKLTRYQEYYVFGAEPNYHCLIRYLRARDFDVKKSYDLLKSTLEWLEDFKPYLITASKMTKEAATGKIFCRGFDKFNRPVVYMSPGKENTYDGEGNIQLLVYSLFTAVARMPPGVSQMTWICNFEGYTMKNAPSLSVCKQTVSILSSHFPERLGVALIVNPPKVFSWFWKLISPFIPPVTKEKIKFCNSSKKEDMIEFFSPYFTLDMLPKDFNGNLDNTFTEAVWEEEKKIDDTRLERIAHIVDVSELYNNPKK
ncbi:hypothetical protein C9374_001086 [Naegleria lovaniensis]|uniref:CRAL-TRIO domain-containing protein n=1 Tax=Naegleria lovaniensis TaxID=51637 RepID=A0AA88KRR9_NAELO|nr:uncharacterized protein C9374_001086 [Naegleria lovaniensis]KAG2387492.1 hypothetical protein C9374_001086 [Naegleria lovaniensis]